MDGSITAFGDYFQCLQIQGPSPNRNGKHCMAELRHISSGTAADGSVDSHLTKILPALNYHNIHHGLCLPSDCSDKDIVQLLTEGEIRP